MKKRDWNSRESDERVLEVLHRHFRLGHGQTRIARDMGLGKNQVIGICDRMRCHVEGAE